MCLLIDKMIFCLYWSFAMFLYCFRRPEIRSLFSFICFNEASNIEIFGLLDKYLKHELVTIFDLDQINNNRMHQFNFWIHRRTANAYTHTNILEIGTLEALWAISLNKTFYWLNHRKSGKSIDKVISNTVAKCFGDGRPMWLGHALHKIIHYLSLNEHWNFDWN